MIINPEVLFLHIPKTAGWSCTVFLCQSLTSPVFLSTLKHQEMTRYFNATLIPGFSHETLEELQSAKGHLRNQTGIVLDDIKLIVAVLRHPYEIELSNYHFYRESANNILGDKLLRDARAEWRISLAQGDFADFVEKSGHFRVRDDGSDIRCEDYFMVDGKLDPRIRLMRCETLSTDFPLLLGPFTSRDAVAFPTVNRSQRGAFAPFENLDEGLQQLIYRKHQWVFDNGYYRMPP